MCIVVSVMSTRVTGPHFPTKRLMAVERLSEQEHEAFVAAFAQEI
jgi:hypothetical protein